MPMTDPAMQAAMGAPQGQPPMDPSMGGMPPQGQPPMDPSMGGMPPQGAPMPPQGGTGDPVLDQLLAMGFQPDQQGNWYDPNGQPVPPEALEQIAQQIMAQMGGMPPQGAPMPPQGQPPMDPSMGGMPPMDPGMMPPQGAPMPPAGPEEGMPQQGDPMMMLLDNIDAMIDERMSNLDKRISALTDKLDTVRSLLEDLMDGKESKGSKELAAEADKDINDFLAASQASEQVPTPDMLGGAPQVQVPIEQVAQGMPQNPNDMNAQLDLMAALGGGQ